MRLSLLIFSTLSWSALGQITPGPGFVRFAGADGVGVGDNGPAQFGVLAYPKALAFDPQGNLYIADFASARVRKVSPGGIITTVAGNGTNGFSGDSGLATSAELSSPTGLAVDAAGNLFIADGPNARIRKVTPSGIITTFAGDGTVPTLRPWQIAIDSKGNLYAADGDQTNVRKIDPSGAITSVAGNGQLGFSGDGGPATSAMIVAVGLAVDAAGNVLIAGGGHIRVVTPNGKISTLADGTGEANKFDGGGLSIGTDAKIYMADNANGRAVKFNADGTGFDIVAGTGTYGFSEGCGSAGAALQKIAKNAQLAQPEAVAVDAAGAVYITDSANGRIRKVTPDGLIATFAGPGAQFSGDGGPALSAGLANPKGIAVDPAGSVYFADSRNNRIRKIGVDGVIQTIAGAGGPTSIDDPACFAPNDAFLRRPSGIALDHDGNLFVADTGNNRIRKIAKDGTGVIVAGTGIAGFTGDGGPAIEAQLNGPSGVVVDADGNVFASDTMNNVIREITPDGKIKTVIPGVGGGLAVDAAGNFYYGGSLAVYRKNPSGDVAVVAGTGDFEGSIIPGGPFHGPGDLGFAGAVAVSAAGTIAVADTLANRVQRVSASCAVDDPATLQAGGVAYDAQGSLYVSEANGGAIWQLPAGAVPTSQGPTPLLGALGVFNAASFEVVPPPPGQPPGPRSREPIAPGELVVLHGICMAPTETAFGRFDSHGVLPKKLADTQVTFDGVAAPLLFAQSGEILLVAPYGIAGKQVTTMTVTNHGGSDSKKVGVINARAGIFTTSGFGAGQAATANADGTLNSPDNPAGRGKLIVLYATGLGQTNPPGTDGLMVKGLLRATATVKVIIGGQNANVVFAGDAPGFVGLSQINAFVPQEVTPGFAVPVSVVAAGNASPQMVTIAVK